MTDEQVAAVAAGLTRAQREALGHIEVKPWPMPLRWSALVGYSLEAIGLAKRTFWTDRTYLTSDGIRVRQHLTDTPA